jgi:hypothetical protein
MVQVLARLWLLAWSTCAFVAWPGAARAATVEWLYSATVPGDVSEAARARAAEEALRQVAVRVTGRRAAATDPALAAVYADARRFAQTFQPAAGGQVTVGFDQGAVDAALARAGQPVWSRERPATLVLLVVDRPPARVLAGGPDSEDKRAVERAALARGVPLAWPGALDAAGAQAVTDHVLSGRVEALREFAARYGAERVLAARVGSVGGSWRVVEPAESRTGEGAPADALHVLADRMAAEFAVGAGGGGAIALLGVEIAGVAGLAEYAAATAALQALPNVRNVQLEAARGDVARFRLNFQGDVNALARAAGASGRLVAEEPVAADGVLRFRLRP